MREVFIYYRVRPSNEVSTRAAVIAFQARLRGRYPALTARLLQRSDEADEHQTWMETYATDPMKESAGVSPEMQAEIEAEASSALDRLLDGPRHAEVFTACAS